VVSSTIIIWRHWPPTRRSTEIGPSTGMVGLKNQPSQPGSVQAWNTASGGAS
jgi:hypothetical protein